MFGHLSIVNVCVISITTLFLLIHERLSYCPLRSGTHAHCDVSVLKRLHATKLLFAQRALFERVFRLIHCYKCVCLQITCNETEIEAVSADRSTCERCVVARNS